MQKQTEYFSKWQERWRFLLNLTILKLLQCLAWSKMLKHKSKLSVNRNCAPHYLRVSPPPWCLSARYNSGTHKQKQLCLLLKGAAAAARVINISNASVMTHSWLQVIMREDGALHSSHWCVQRKMSETAALHQHPCWMPSLHFWAQKKKFAGSQQSTTLSNKTQTGSENSVVKLKLEMSEHDKNNNTASRRLSFCNLTGCMWPRRVTSVTESHQTALHCWLWSLHTHTHTH